MKPRSLRMSPANRRREEAGELMMGIVDAKIEFTWSGNHTELIELMCAMRQNLRNFSDEVGGVEISVNGQEIGE